MNDRSSQSARGARQVPLDHLRPGGRRAGDETSRGRTGPDATPAPADEAAQQGHAGREGHAEPAEDLTPGGADADATRGRATRSPAEVATRRHLEGSEQGPQ